MENTATTCDTTRNDAARSQERTPENDVSDRSGEEVTQDTLQFTSDDHQIALNLQQLRTARSSLQRFVPSYTTIQENISNVRYSAGQTVVAQPLSPYAPADTYHPLLAAPGETLQYSTVSASQPYHHVSSSAHISTVHASQVPGYMGPYLSSQQFSQQPIPTPISTPRPHQTTLPRPFPIAALNIPTYSSQPDEHPDMGIPDAPTSTERRGRTQQPRHICTVCDKGFLRPSSLRTHSLTHSGEKPHSCPVVGCDRHGEGKGFSVRSNMTRHVRTRHRDWNGEISGPSINGEMAAMVAR